MQLSDTRFTRIEGTQVILLAANDSEARLALKELRHKKKELSLWKRRLRRRRAALKRRDRHHARTGFFPAMTPLGYVARSLGAVVHLLSGWQPFPGAPLPTTLATVAEDIHTLDEVLLNVNQAILHIEGKLIDG